MASVKSRHSVEEIVGALRANGTRITTLRECLIGILLRSERPLSAAEILTSLKKYNLTPNKSSIYRELDFLLELNHINQIDVLEGMKRYEWHSDDDSHHHHIVCTKCGVVECIELCFNEEDIARKVAKKSGFTVTSHLLEFFGICSECR